LYYYLENKNSSPVDVIVGVVAKNNWLKNEKI
jgi:hypothetical protein